MRQGIEFSIRIGRGDGKQYQSNLYSEDFVSTGTMDETAKNILDAMVEHTIKVAKKAVTDPVPVETSLGPTSIIVTSDCPYCGSDNAVSLSDLSFLPDKVKRIKSCKHYQGFCQGKFDFECKEDRRKKNKDRYYQDVIERNK